jgi:hypothetical protein
MKRSSLSRVGAISHVSCIDRRLAPAATGNPLVAAYAQLVGFGLGQLEGLCTMLGGEARSVIARCSTASSEVFLELSGNVHVQYCGILGASHPEQSLWVEGPGGSIRVEGAILWWRKRGWPKFLPWRLRFSSSAAHPPVAAERSALFAAIVRSSEQDTRVQIDK